MIGLCGVVRVSRDLQLPNSTWQSNYADATKHTIKISQQQTGGGTFVFGVDGQGHPEVALGKMALSSVDGMPSCVRGP